MKNKLLSVIIALISSVSLALASENGRKGVSFAYDVNFEMHFDNREFDKNNFSNSSTLFGARLTPSIGFDVKQKGGMHHRVMMGVDVMKEFGAGSDYKVLGDVSLWYRMQKKLGKTEVLLTAGVFPRRFSN